MKASFFAIAGALTLAAGTCVRAEDPDTQADYNQTIPAVTPYVKVGDIVFYRSYEDAFPKARKEGKLVMVYRMLGELDGLTWSAAHAMRTGVLKDKTVAKTVNEKFVCAWKNIEGETTCGGSFAHEVTDKAGFCSTGDGEHNTQICVFTPDGKLLDVMAGYQTPEDLAAELNWACKELAPIAGNEKIKDDVKKGMLQRTIDSRLTRTKNFCTTMDQKYVREHILDSWTQFSVEELVKGRGFGDHFFGRYGDKAMPGEGIGNVPQQTQNSLDSQRMNEISAEALRLKRQWNLAGEKLRREIKSKLIDLETEYDGLKSKK